MHNTRQVTETLHARDFIVRTHGRNQLCIVHKTSLAILRQVWFHPHMHSYRKSSPTSIRQQYLFSLRDRSSPRTRSGSPSYFGALSIPSVLKDSQLRHGQPDPSEREVTTRYSPILYLLNAFFVSSHGPAQN